MNAHRPLISRHADDDLEPVLFIARDGSYFAIRGDGAKVNQLGKEAMGIDGSEFGEHGRTVSVAVPGLRLAAAAKSSWRLRGQSWVLGIVPRGWKCARSVAKKTAPSLAKRRGPFSNAGATRASYLNGILQRSRLAFMIGQEGRLDFWMNWR